MSARLWVLSLAVLAGLYIAKVWVLYLLVDTLRTRGPADDSTAVGAGAASQASAAAAAEDPSSPSPSPGHRAAARALRDGDVQRALEELRKCNDGGCLGLFAELHITGTGVPRNLSEALRLYTAGAALGDPDAQYALGALHSNLLEGEGGPSGPRRQEALGVLYLYAASVAGHPGALMAMGYRHAQGYGVPKACSTAALNYIEVARRVADVYSAGMPQAVELVRLGVDGDRKAMSASEVSLFVEIASSGDTNIAAAVGKRYLLGIEGFRQNYQRAAHHLQQAAEKHHGGAMGLLGYMYCLGLGVARNLDIAFSYFTASAAQDDALGHNGLGYIYFQGTAVQERNLELAFQHFNASAHGGSADGMFNLASLYLTGTGTDQSLHRAALWYTHALDRGHTPAAYTLAVMHLNGVGTVRNCKIAVELLKRVCERGSWVSQKLQEAYDGQRDGLHDTAAWLFLRLAEAGHEVAQMNVAHLLDAGSSRLLHEAQDELDEEVRALTRVHAQRHYEMSAEQGNALSELRLGDYAYYGWGLRTEDSPEEEEEGGELEGQEEDSAQAPKEEVEEDMRIEAEEEVAQRVLQEPRLVRQEVDLQLALVHYKRTASMRRAGDWMQPFVARASFNLGYMHQFGIGVESDAPLARRYYNRCTETDPSGVQTPVLVMLVVLSLQTLFAELPPAEALALALVRDPRTHILALHIVGGAVLLSLRIRFARAPRRERRAAGPTAAGSTVVSGIY